MKLNELIYEAKNCNYNLKQFFLASSTIKLPFKIEYISQTVITQAVTLSLMVIWIKGPAFSYFKNIPDLYGPSLGNCPSTDRLFVDIRKRVDREARNLRNLLALQGALDLVLTASAASEKPELRCEEKAFKKNYFKSKSGDRIEVDLTSDKAVLSWQKTLLACWICSSVKPMK